MAGLNLRVGAYGSAGSSGLLPSAANQPDGTTISQKAFGIGMGASTGSKAANGAMIAGAAGAVLLAWLWWTLPR